MTEHKDHADVKIHPPVLTLLHITVAYLLAWLMPIPLVVPNILRFIGFGLVVIGIIFAGAAFYAFNKARTTLDPHGSVSTIVSDGVYRFTRNPIYLAFLFMLIGFLLYDKSYWGVLLVPVFVFAMNRLVIQHEEAYLEKKFGDVYNSYKSRVRRWL